MKRFLLPLVAFAIACTTANAGYWPDPNVSTVSYATRVAAGEIDGSTFLRKFGEGAATTTPGLVATGPTKAEAFPVAAETIQCSSSDVNDTAAGTGLRTLTMSGLDASWVDITSDITMNGTSLTTATAESYLRASRAFGTSVGTYGTTNVGTITCVGVTSADVKFTIPPDHGQSLLPFTTVPAGKTLYVEQLRLYPEGNKLPTINLYMRLNDDSGTNFPDRSIFEAPQLSQPISENSIAPAIFPEKTDIFFIAQTASGTSNVNAEIEGFLVDN